LSFDRFYNAHETSSVEDYAIAIMAGDLDFKLYSGIVVLDTSRAKFSVKDWKTLLALKIFRGRLKDALNARFDDPKRELSEKQKICLETWQAVFERAWNQARDKKGA
jgi:ATP-dependent RNA helicase DHX29